MDVEAFHAQFLSSPALRGGGRASGAVGAGAAILHEVGEELVHPAIVGAVDQRAALPLLPDQPRPAEAGEMEGERAVGKAEPLGQRAGGQALLAGLDEQAEQRQPVLLGERGQSGDGLGRLHARPSLSTIIEISGAVRCQRHFGRVEIYYPPLVYRQLKAAADRSGMAACGRATPTGAGTASPWSS